MKSQDQQNVDFGIKRIVDKVIVEKFEIQIQSQKDTVEAEVSFLLSLKESLKIWISRKMKLHSSKKSDRLPPHWEMHVSRHLPQWPNKCFFFTAALALLWLKSRSSFSQFFSANGQNVGKDFWWCGKKSVQLTSQEPHQHVQGNLYDQSYRDQILKPQSVAMRRRSCSFAQDDNALFSGYGSSVPCCRRSMSMLGQVIRPVGLGCSPC